MPSPAPSPTPSKPPGSFASAWSKWGDFATKILTILVIPMTGMVVTFYVRLSLAEERIAQLQERCDAYGSRVDDLDRRLSETGAQIREVRVLVETIRDNLRRP